VLVIGAGVAGLSAIATAKSLGVEFFIYFSVLVSVVCFLH
jgi:flavin-dependent dehydrogenase